MVNGGLKMRALNVVLLSLLLGTAGSAYALTPTLTVTPTPTPTLSPDCSLAQLGNSAIGASTDVVAGRMTIGFLVLHPLAKKLFVRS